MQVKQYRLGEVVFYRKSNNLFTAHYFEKELLKMGAVAVEEKQELPEFEELDIAREIFTEHGVNSEIVRNRNYIIDLQEKVNEIIKYLKSK